MVQDTLVGLVGAILIVGSMVAAIDYQVDESPGEVEDAPAAIGTSVWRAQSCEAASLYWAPSMEALDEVVGPHLTPADGPLPDSGFFWLFVFECSRSSVDGLSVSPPSGAAALVAVEEPEDTHNVSAPDGWVAVPTWYGPGDRVSEVFQDHGFDHTRGQAGLGTTSTPLSDQVRLTLETPGGYLEADVTVTGPTEERVVDGALVGTGEQTFSVFSGEERMDRRQDGTATVETRGTTWVERLGLEPTPYAIAYDQAMSWNFTFEHEPWETNASGSADEDSLPSATSTDDSSETSLAGRLLAEIGR